MPIGSQQTIRSANRYTKFYLKTVGLWLLLMVGWQLIASIAAGKLEFQPNELYLWDLWAPTVLILTLETGIAAVALLMPWRRARISIQMSCAAIIGLVTPPLIGLLTGLVEEKMGASLLFRWTAMEGWTWGIVSALPSALAIVVAVIWLGRTATKHNSNIPTS